MQRQDADRVGRRPLLSTFGGNNRQMLQNIRDTLSYLQPTHKDTTGDSGAASGTSRGAESGMQIKAELLLQAKAADLCHSSPNLASTVEKSNGGSKGMPPSRLGYNQKAMAKIRESLQGFQINESTTVSGALTNGYDDETAPISKYILRQLMQMGYDEVSEGTVVFRTHQTVSVTVLI
ncbi:hypothetical protein LSAT2_027821 [Lamellibrachia satsuma]|nr:hypothetical protein LSAT2_027821 [Lamellibrachia satsuma]